MIVYQKAIDKDPQVFSVSPQESPQEVDSTGGKMIQFPDQSQREERKSESKKTKPKAFTKKPWKPKTKESRKKRVRRYQKRRAASKGKELLFSLAQAIQSFFPELLDQLSEIEDPRLKDSPLKEVEYRIESILCATIAMYIFREGSRNAMNADRLEGEFMKNYKTIFQVDLPHMDTVDAVLRILNPDQLEKLKVEFIHVLLKRKVFHKFRFLKKYFLIAIDGTLEVSYEYKHCDQCTYKVFNKGTKREKTKWFHYVLEAKLVCSNGFSISIGTEFIENPKEQFDKQDCELKAFKRLAKELKKNYPQLPICLVMDALYANQSVFSICQENKWAWIINQKPDTLPSVWKQIEQLSKGASTYHEIQGHQKKQVRRSYTWINGLQYQGFEMSWVECIETQKIEDGKDKTTRFVYLSSQKMSTSNVSEGVRAGRLRWKIENEGFNNQKNLGFGLGHKFSRVSYQASQNYYQCLQIAAMITQLVELSQGTKKKLTQWRVSLIHLWKKGIPGFLSYAEGWEKEFQMIIQQSVQFRFS